MKSSIINFNDFISKKIKTKIDFSDIEEYFRDLTDERYGFEISIDIGEFSNMHEIDDISGDQKYPEYLHHVLKIKSKDIRNWFPDVHHGRTSMNFNNWQKTISQNNNIINGINQMSSQLGLKIGSININGDIIKQEI